MPPMKIVWSLVKIMVAERGDLEQRASRVVRSNRVVPDRCEGNQGHKHEGVRMALGPKRP